MHSQSHAHHYVPQWYQRRFLPNGTTKFFYLDLHPDTVTRDGRTHTRSDILRWGPSRCFYREDLYALRFGGRTTDAMERQFFGRIDDSGKLAVERFADYVEITDGAIEALNYLPAYMGAQRFRTPRGLEQLRILATPLGGSNAVLAALSEAFQAYTAMWMEGVWEIFDARKSPTKFLVTDNPVTFYCKWLFTSEWTHPNDSSLKQIGTRTLFPLGLDKCLIITHLQLMRNPWATPTELRENARYHGRTMKHMGDIQFGRELDEEDVLRINHILKTRATRYVAAVEQEWLYPERVLRSTDWRSLDDDWFLLPHLWHVPFTTGIAAGGGRTPPFAMDEYGLNPGDARYENRLRRVMERESFERAKREWAKMRVGKPTAQVDERIGRSVGEGLMQDYLREIGLMCGPKRKPFDSE